MDYSADLRDPRQGFLLWRHLYGSPPRDGNSGSPDIAEIALAERVCGAPDRDVAARLSGSRPDLWRSAFAACSCHLRDLLQRGANASRIAQGHAPTPTCPAIRLYCRHANLVWLAPSLCEDMIFGRDRSTIRRKRRVAGPLVYAALTLSVRHHTHRTSRSAFRVLATSCAASSQLGASFIIVLKSE